MLSSEQLEKFNNDGYLVLENFLPVKNCESLRQECQNIIDSSVFNTELEKLCVFEASSNNSGSQLAEDYFLTSTDKIRPFLEKKAKELIENNKNNKDFDQTKYKIFNKIGHALHALNPVFKANTFNEQTKQAFKSFGYKKPIVCQSMYIFKQPFIGGEVCPHQDGSYLYTEPLEGKVVGIWIALEDCTLDNGCLQFIPGSHKGELDTRFIRNPNQEEFNNGKYLIYTKEMPKYDDNLFVPAQVKAGDAIMIDGLVVHKSSPNLSSKSRHIYTFHVYESEGAEFSKENWLVENPTSFLNLYEH